MAIEPTEPYDPREDLNFRPGYTIQDYIRNMMTQKGRAEPMGAGVPDMYGVPELNPADERRLDVPPDEGTPDLGEFQGEDLAQRFIRQQLAGDVVPMPGKAEAIQRILDANRAGARGAGFAGRAGIDTMGGEKSPYLDLLNVLNFRRGGRE